LVSLRSRAELPAIEHRQKLIENNSSLPHFSKLFFLNIPVTGTIQAHTYKRNASHLKRHVGDGHFSGPLFSFQRMLPGFSNSCLQITELCIPISLLLLFPNHYFW
jgi:hypothetical protein